MSMTTREAFEKGTETFNAHDVRGFGEVLDGAVVFEAPGGARGKGKAACLEFYGGWFHAFPDAHVDVHGLHILDDVAVEEGAFTRDAPRSPSHPDGRRAAHRPRSQDPVHPGPPHPRRQAHLV